MDTIYALSSGAPPAGIAVVRVSGPCARDALSALSGRLPAPRRAVTATLRDAAGNLLDRALVLWLPGPATATGEDTCELHLHGGRAVVRAVEDALGAIAGLRRAEPGEFTRRAFLNGRIDLAEAEGLADLLAAETELQRRSAVVMAGGALSRQVDEWRLRVLAMSAAIEAVLDFGDEDDVGDNLPAGFEAGLAELAGEIRNWLDAPRSEAMREGFRVVLAGPPNAGKSSLFNALLEDEAAIVTNKPGTTRDVLERHVAISGVPFTFVDTAGLRTETADPIEQHGIARARGQFERSDLILWLGPEGEGPTGSWEVATKHDLGGDSKRQAVVRVSSITGEGISALKDLLVCEARKRFVSPVHGAINDRQREMLKAAHEALVSCASVSDPLIASENLRAARVAFDRLVGRTSTEDMLDLLFGKFCIGK